jgi:hypothetical protein
MDDIVKQMAAECGLGEYELAEARALAAKVAERCAEEASLYWTGNEAAAAIRRMFCGQAPVLLQDEAEGRGLSRWLSEPAQSRLRAGCAVLRDPGDPGKGPVAG